MKTTEMRSGRFAVPHAEPRWFRVERRETRWVVVCDTRQRPLSMHDRHVDAIHLAQALARHARATLSIDEPAAAASGA